MSLRKSLKVTDEIVFENDAFIYFVRDGLVYRGRMGRSFGLRGAGTRHKKVVESSIKRITNRDYNRYKRNRCLNDIFKARLLKPYFERNV